MEYPERLLLIAVGKILGITFGCTEEREGICRIKMNDDLNNLIRNKNIISYIKTQRLRLSGHVDRMTNYKVLKILCVCVCVCVCVRKATSTELARRQNIRWENDIKGDLRILEINNWTKFIQDRVKWKKKKKKRKRKEEKEEEKRKRSRKRKRRREKEAEKEEQKKKKKRSRKRKEVEKEKEEEEKKKQKKKKRKRKRRR